MLNTRGLTGRQARTGHTRYQAVAALAIGSAILGGGMLLAGCSGNSSSASSASGTSAQGGSAANAPGPEPSAASSAAGGPFAQKSLGGTGTTARLAPAGDIIYTAQLTVRAQSVSAATARAAQIAASVGGYISDETTSANPDHPSESTASVQLKIPVASYPATLSQLSAGLGTQLALRQQAQDVTQQVADVNSQVTSDQAAIAQLRVLLGHAGSISSLLSVQNQINAEESGLESMLAQQRALGHQTSYATVTLSILGPKAKPLVHRPKAPPSLAGGFGAGWRALRIAVSWTLAFLGAIAPFAVVAALAALLVYRGRRWAIRRRPKVQAASPES
jgi:hypothetical protein